MTRPGCGLERSGLVLDQPVLSAVGQVPWLSRWTGNHPALHAATAAYMTTDRVTSHAYLVGGTARIGRRAHTDIEQRLSP